MTEKLSMSRSESPGRAAAMSRLASAEAKSAVLKVLGLDGGRLTHSRHCSTLLLLFIVLEDDLQRSGCRSGFGDLLACEGEDKNGFLWYLEREFTLIVGRRVLSIVELDGDRYLG